MATIMSMTVHLVVYDRHHLVIIIAVIVIQLVLA